MLTASHNQYAQAQNGSFIIFVYFLQIYNLLYKLSKADRSGRAVYGTNSLRPLQH
jgi:hypothetical protein